MAYEVEVVADSVLPVMNDSGLELSTLSGNKGFRELASKMSRWVENGRSAAGKTSMFDRGMFTPPDNPYDEMRAARNAVKYDSVVAGVAETTEAFAFQGVKWESPNADESDVFNQLATDQNLDATVRSMWREEYTYAQFVCAKLWGWRTYTVRGTTTKGNVRKKSYRIWAPLQLRLLDPAKVVPVGVGPLAAERLAWQASVGEIGSYTATTAGDVVDPLMMAFFTGPYVPDSYEAEHLAQLGVDPNRLLSMDPDWVFRHTMTKPDYERFADVRLKSVFTLLDLKRHLMASDRASLVGSANYILLIRKGLKDEPAQAEEMANLRENYNFIAKMPVIISDHRLSIDIIAPKTDFALSTEKYEVLNNQILMRLLGTLSVAGRGQRNETQDTLGSAVAKVMENRRHMLKRALEIQISRAVVQHPKNAGVFDTEPNLVYTPRNLALSMSQSYIQGLLALRTQHEISRETILEYFGLDQETEALRLEIEDERFDDIFKTVIPFAAQGVNAPAAPAGTTKDGPNPSPASRPASGQPADGKAKTTPNGAPEAPGVSGARGGRPPGGGTSTASPQSTATPRTPNGNKSTK